EVLSINNTLRNLLLSSSAPIIMSVSQDNFNCTDMSVDDQVEVLFALQNVHQSFISSLLCESSPGEWHVFYLNGSSVWGVELGNGRNNWEQLFGEFLESSFRDHNAKVSTLIFNDPVAEYVNEGKNRFKYVPLCDCVLQELTVRSHIHWKKFSKPNGPIRNAHVVASDWAAVRITAILLALGKVDFSPVTFSLNNQDCAIFDYIAATSTFTHNVVVVPRAQLLPSWTLFLRVFGPVVWAALLGTVLAYALAWSGVAGESPAASVAAALRAFSSCGGAPQDRVRAAPQRLQLAGALLASAVVIAAVYQGRLFSLMTKPERYADMDTLEELANSRLPVVGTMAIPHLVHPNNLHSKSMQEALLKLEYRQSTPTDIIRHLTRRDSVAWYTFEGSWKELEFAGIISDYWHQMREPLRNALGFMHARKNWPWTDIVNQQIYCFHSAGLMSKWENDAQRLYRMYMYYKSREKGTLTKTRYKLGAVTDGDPEPWELGFKDVSWALKLLGVGLAISALVFLQELWRGRKRLPTY
ncbi:Uncharacterized protein GBIM_12246, partial [Gryllus bimaculatus]